MVGNKAIGCQRRVRLEEGGKAADSFESGKTVDWEGLTKMYCPYVRLWEKGSRERVKRVVGRGEGGIRVEGLERA